MKPSETNLEKLIKRAVKPQDIEESQMLLHWDGLGQAGDRTVLRVLRRQKAWDTFVDWASRHPETRERLRRLIDRAGATEEAVRALQRIGIQPSSGETQRTVADRLVTIVKDNATEGWPQAHSELLRDSDLLEAVVEILEEDPSAAAFSFLLSLLELPLNEHQDRLIRKSLYHLRQKGFGVRKQKASKSPKELFFFGENRLALWHPMFYFRNTSAFSNLGDLYVTMIQEGKDFEISERQNSARLDSGRLQELTTDYSRRLREQSGLDIPFQQVPTEEAYYLLSRSASLLQDTPGETRFKDFLRFIGLDQQQLRTPHFDAVAVSATQTEILISRSYFTNWFLPAEGVEEFFASMEASEKGPIILPEARQREARHAAAAEAFARYFQKRNRDIWSVAFEKAAWFLERSDPTGSKDARAISEAFRNEAISIDSIPAARILFDRTIEALAKQRQAQQEAEKQSSLIVSPEEFARQQQKRK